MPRIFISYRREDSAPYAGWLVKLLSEHFQADDIFMDVDSLAPGEDFVSVIEQAVSTSDVMIALIGPEWLQVQDSNGRRRLDNPEDFVRVELEAALGRGIRVIPALVHGASVPRSTDLPESLQPLVRRNAVELSDAHFSHDVGGLIRVLESVHQVGARAVTRRVDSDRARSASKPPRFRQEDMQLRARALVIPHVHLRHYFLVFLPLLAVLALFVIVGVRVFASESAALRPSEQSRSEIGLIPPPTALERQAQCDRDAHYREYLNVDLMPRDVPSGLKRIRTCFVRNVLAARLTDVSLKTLVVEGRQISVDLWYAGVSTHGVKAVDATIVAYQAKSGAIWGFDRAVRRAHSWYGGSFPVHGLGDAGSGFAYRGAGGRGQVALVYFHRGRISASVFVLATVRRYAEQSLIRLARIVDERIEAHFPATRPTATPTPTPFIPPPAVVPTQTGGSGGSQTPTPHPLAHATITPLAAPTTPAYVPPTTPAYVPPTTPAYVPPTAAPSPKGQGYGSSPPAPVCAINC